MTHDGTEAEAEDDMRYWFATCSGCGRQYQLIDWNCSRHTDTCNDRYPGIELTPNRKGDDMKTEGTMSRQESARCWAKVLAYIACGKPEKARPWAERLLAWWRQEGVL